MNRVSYYTCNKKAVYEKCLKIGEPKFYYTCNNRLDRVKAKLTLFLRLKTLNERNDKIISFNVRNRPKRRLKVRKEEKTKCQPHIRC